MTTTPGADELRARRNLLRALNGARLTAPPVPPPRPPRLPDWRTGETADLTPPEPAPTGPPTPPPVEVEPAGERQPDTAPKPKTRPTRPRYVPIPSARVQHAYQGLPPRVRWALYTGTAATAGWSLGMPQLAYGWIVACGRDTGSTTAAAVLGLALIAATAAVDRRTRRWWPPLAWVCRIPLASALLALTLYAPGVTP